MLHGYESEKKKVSEKMAKGKRYIYTFIFFTSAKVL